MRTRIFHRARRGRMVFLRSGRKVVRRRSGRAGRKRRKGTGAKGFRQARTRSRGGFHALPGFPSGRRATIGRPHARVPRWRRSRGWRTSPDSRKCRRRGPSRRRTPRGKPEFREGRPRNAGAIRPSRSARRDTRTAFRRRREVARRKGRTRVSGKFLRQRAAFGVRRFGLPRNAGSRGWFRLRDADTGHSAFSSRVISASRPPPGGTPP